MARKILLADDSVTAQNMGRRILTDAGYEVITVNNGSAAFKKIAEQLPELIVLDVYMPGYSGLEVCQRLKESRETANIPILLTVGKLEPFKEADARKVKADAFIVKPFEASELLTALTRLEDKIVPRPASEKKSSFAKVWESLESTSGRKKGEKFGDKETGWKDRLIIPTGEPKAEEAEEESAAKKSKGTKKSDEAAVGGSVPPDITPEEVAAIAAAAAAFGKKDEPAASTTETADALPVIAPEAETTSPEIPAEPEPIVAAEPAAEEKTAAAAVPAEVTPAVSEEKIEAKIEAAVEAAPVEAKAEEIAAQAEISAKTEEPQTAGALTAEKVEQARVARWIAHEVPLEPSERGSILDEEMRAAGAVLQAAKGEVDFSAASLLAEAAAAASVEKVPEVVSEASAPVVEDAPAPVAAAAQESVQPEAVTEAVAIAAIASQEPEPPKEDSAFAAAAAASSATEIPDAVASTEVAATFSNGQPAQPEAELAAAWAQWKEIRETVVNPQVASKSSDSEPVEAPRMDADTLSAAAASNPAIASIVDSMLAELKPKLMEEIARKLANEKK